MVGFINIIYIYDSICCFQPLLGMIEQTDYIIYIKYVTSICFKSVENHPQVVNPWADEHPGII